MNIDLIPHRKKKKKKKITSSNKQTKLRWKCQIRPHGAWNIYFNSPGIDSDEIYVKLCDVIYSKQFLGLIIHVIIQLKSRQ